MERVAALYLEKHTSVQLLMFSLRCRGLANCCSWLQACSGSFNRAGVFAEGRRSPGTAGRSPHAFSCLLVMKPRKKSSGAGGGGAGAAGGTGTPSKTPSRGSDGAGVG